MTGPPVPHQNPAPGSNAIGSFIIGVSPIGDIPFFDYWQTVISQYGNAGILTQLIANMAQYLDPTINLEAFFDNIWNVNSAVGYGLDVWGRIVGVIRTVNLPSAGRYFGFEEQGITVDPYNQSPFYNGGALTTSFQLSDDAFRVLIFAKALANITNGSIQALNQLLLNLFPGRGNAYVTDGGGEVFNVTGAGAGAGNVVQLVVGDGSQNSVSGLSSGLTVNIKGVGGTTEANGTQVIDIVFPSNTLGRVNLRNTTFVHSYTSGGTVDTGDGNGNMSMTYTFGFALTSTEVAIITQSGILPKSTGSSLKIVQKVI